MDLWSGEDLNSNNFLKYCPGTIYIRIPKGVLKTQILRPDPIIVSECWGVEGKPRNSTFK